MKMANPKPPRCAIYTRKSTFYRGGEALQF